MRSNPNNKIFVELGKRIKHYRTIRGLSQKDVAKKLNVTWETVSRWENGKVSPMRRLEDLANAFDIPVSYLINDSTPPKKSKKLEDYDGIPYLGELPNSLKEFYIKYKRTLFKLHLESFLPSHSYAVKLSPTIKNLTTIPIDKNTILIITPLLQYKTRYVLLYDKLQQRFVLADKVIKGKTYDHVANIIAVILQ